MISLWRQTASFPPAVRLLMANQFAINLAFYMLMPYLAAHLAGSLGLAAWAVGLVLGVRNLSQQGMFLIGGTLADRYGYKAPIMAGCLLRTLGFGLLGWVDTLPALIVASAATGFAGALFNPAVRAYLAAEAWDRRVDAFATFNVYYQAGMLLGPLVGLALLAADFRAVCAAAALIFAALTLLNGVPCRTGAATPPRWLPGGRTGSVADRPGQPAVPALLDRDDRVLRPDLPGVPRPAPGRGDALGDVAGTRATSGLFVVSAAVAVAGQLRLTGWAKRRWTPGQALVRGLAAMGLAFLPLVFTPPGAPYLSLVSLTAAVVFLAVGSAIVYPFEMDTVVALSGNRLVATHYGLYNTVSGLGITLGNLITGALWDFAVRQQALWITWLTLTATGLACATAVAVLSRTGRLTAPVRVLAPA